MIKTLITSPLGLSSTLSSELKFLGHKPYDTFVTGTFVDCNLEQLYAINIQSRIANKVFINLGSSQCMTFDELFDFVYSLDYSDYLNPGQRTVVTAVSKSSQLESVPSIQSICQKAIYNKNGNPSLESDIDKDYHGNNQKTDLEIFIYFQNNICSVFLNTSGQSLHQRGYRKQTGEAPIKENLAAAMVLMCSWKFKSDFYDLFCGSGTIAIEAAMIAKNIAPGLNRSFGFQKFKNYDAQLFEKTLDTIKSKIYTDKIYPIHAYDIDPNMIDIAIQNAQNAGVADTINFEIKDFVSVSPIEGFMISNPPYGNRLQNVDLRQMYYDIYQLYFENNLKGGIITTYEGFEKFIHTQDWTKKYIFNGQDKCEFWIKK